MRIITTRRGRVSGIIIQAFILISLAAVPALAQDPKLQISDLDRIATRAAESVDVTIDEPLLKLAATFLSTKRSPDEAKIKELVSGLKGIYVRYYKFEKEGEYSDSDVEAIRSQLRSSSWA